MSDNRWGYAVAGLLALLGIGGVVYLVTRNSGGSTASRGRGALTVVEASEQDSFASPQDVPALPAPVAGAGGGWANDEVTEIERDASGFIVRQTVRRNVHYA